MINIRKEEKRRESEDFCFEEFNWILLLLNQVNLVDLVEVFSNYSD